MYDMTRGQCPKVANGGKKVRLEVYYLAG